VGEKMVTMNERQDFNSVKPAALTLSNWGFAFVALWVSGAIALGLFIYLSRSLTSPLVLVAFGVAMVGMICAFVCGEWGKKQLVKERDRGYTTATLGMFDLEQRDPKSGRVIREAGEPRPTREERRRRLEAARAFR
jgi:hypothetical protein